MYKYKLEVFTTDGRVLTATAANRIMIGIKAHKIVKELGEGGTEKVIIHTRPPRGYDPIAPEVCIAPPLGVKSHLWRWETLPLP